MEEPGWFCRAVRSSLCCSHTYGHRSWKLEQPQVPLTASGEVRTDIRLVKGNAIKIVFETSIFRKEF